MAEEYDTNHILIVLVLVLVLLYFYMLGDDDKDNKIVYYYKPTCPYCVKMTPIWDSIVLNFPLIKFEKVNVQKHKPDEKIAPLITGVPTILMFRNRRVIKYPLANDYNHLHNWIVMTQQRSP